jgi:hypothetical protein
MRKVLLGMAAVAALTTASASNAASIVFGSTAGDIGTPAKVYSSGPYSVTAYGCNNLILSAFSCTAANIYEKDDPNTANESGIGLASDPSGQGEIWNNQNGWVNAIVLDVLGLTGASSASFIMNSTTDGENYRVLAWNGSAWISLLTGSTNDGAGTPLPGFGTYQYYAFTTDGTVGEGNAFGNVLLNSIVLPDVPEPATWAMMLLGFAGIGFATRRRRQGIAQLA